MRTTRSVYLIRGTEAMTADERLAALDDVVADVPIASLNQLRLSVTDALLLRSPDGLDSEMQRKLERELAISLGDNIAEEEEETE